MRPTTRTMPSSDVAAVLRTSIRVTFRNAQVPIRAVTSEPYAGTGWKVMVFHLPEDMGPVAGLLMADGFTVLGQEVGDSGHATTTAYIKDAR